MPGTRGPGPSLGLLLLLLLGPAGAAAPRRRFEYKLSFKGPGLAPPGAGMSFWSHHGDAILGLDEVRLAPSLRDRGGAVWSRVPVLLSAWEVEVQLRVTGPGRRGAQGVAVWYTRERGRVGSVLGGPASWDGIGILLDSSAGDTQDSPAIRVLAGDGHSPSTQLGGGASRVLGLCRRDFRNRPYPIRARITYWGQRLRVSSNSGLTPHDPDEVCVEVGPLLLAPGGFFGVSAATSTLADDHDVLAFLTYSLHEPGPEAPPQPLPEAEQLRLARRLEALRATLALGAREDVVPKPDSGAQGGGERLSDLEESLSRHSRVLQALGGLSEQLAQARRQWKQQLGAPGQVRPEGGWDSAQLSTLLCGQRTLLQALREMRDAAALMASGARVSFLPVGTKHHFSELRQTLGLLQTDLRSVVKTAVQAPCQPGGCPGVSSCLRPSVLLLFLLAQTVAFFCYVHFRQELDKRFRECLSRGGLPQGPAPHIASALGALRRQPLSPNTQA
ncbi:protein ERGIC-53-like isoform X3 [Oryctolagus cuniculus]|uniref:protein ERGIC-53-like isoform X3 n=1 Tax=Oryctolagus cuniculus TaxID=9986 RepID=UPI00387A7BA4